MSFFIGVTVFSIVIPYLALWLFVKYSYSRRCNSKVCLVGKTAIITGGNKGIGYETTLGLAQRGCRIIIACRSNADKCREAIIKKTHNPNVIVKHLDLTSMDSVRKFAKEINDSEKCIDILINNAGTAVSTVKQTADGLNPVMQVNYFGHVLLTHLLIDMIKKSSDGRIAFLSSHVAFLHNLTLKNLNFYKAEPNTALDDLHIYANSKVCNIIAATVMSEKLKSYNITVNAVHPGGAPTTIYRGALMSDINKMFLFLLYFLVYYLMKTTEEAAQPTLKTVINNSYKTITGTFVWDFWWFPTPRCVRHREFSRQIWEATEKYIALAPNEKL